MPIDPRNIPQAKAEDKTIVQSLSFDEAEYDRFTDLLLQDDDLYNEYQAAVTRAKLAALAAKS